MARYTAETYCVFKSPHDDEEQGWCVKDGDDTIFDIPFRSKVAERQAKRIAFLLNTYGMTG